MNVRDTTSGMSGEDSTASNRPAPLVNPEGMQDNVIHACPMHPEVRQKEPGTCSKCGMALVSFEAASATP